VCPHVMDSDSLPGTDPFPPTRAEPKLPPAPWREAVWRRRRRSSPSSSSSVPSLRSPSSSRSSSSVRCPHLPRSAPWLTSCVACLIRFDSSPQAGTWPGGLCWCTCRWCRRSPGCAGRSPPSPSRRTTAASPSSTGRRLKPPKGFTPTQPHNPPPFSHPDVFVLISAEIR
jgi:hypothetical protein